MEKIKIILAITAGIFISTSMTTSAQVSVGIMLQPVLRGAIGCLFPTAMSGRIWFVWVPGYWAYGGMDIFSGS